MIGTSRFYCVACKRILWAENEVVNSSNSYMTEVSDDTFDQAPLSRRKDLYTHAYNANQIFRTGFYRNEMPLGYCSHCREIHEHQHDQEQASEQDNDHSASYTKEPIVEKEGAKEESITPSECLETYISLEERSYTRM